MMWHCQLLCAHLFLLSSSLSDILCYFLTSPSPSWLSSLFCWVRHFRCYIFSIACFVEFEFYLEEKRKDSCKVKSGHQKFFSQWIKKSQISQNLKESATLLAKEALQNISLKSQLQKTLLFVGSSNAGKTTLINRFLDRNEPAKKTLSLEYTFARKTSSHSLAKDVCHIWELGGGTLFTSVFENANSLTAHGPLTVVVMLDLSELGKLWVTLETLLASIKKNISPTEKESKEISDHPDAAMFEAFPVPLVIIGGKYDLFQEKEPEKKKIVCRCLRYVAHILCGTLIFYSSKDAALVKRVKDTLNHHAFGSSPLKSVCQDYNKPICIPSGSDLLESIEGVGTTKSSLDKIRHIFTTHFPQDEIKSTLSTSDDPANDSSFREPLIDSLRRQKDQELERFCQEMERREKRNN